MLESLANQLGAIVTTGLGAMALARPLATAKFVDMTPVGSMGLSELRATYGGLFAGLGVFALCAQQPLPFQMLGAGWLGAALGRTLSIFADGNRQAKNLGGVLFEAGIGALCLWGQV